MDPTVTTVSSQTIVGQIEIAAKYKPLEKTLLVKVGRVKQLVKEGVGLPDPYVTIDLFPSRLILHGFYITYLLDSGRPLIKLSQYKYFFNSQYFAYLFQV